MAVWYCMHKVPEWEHTDNSHWMKAAQIIPFLMINLVKELFQFLDPNS